MDPANGLDTFDRVTAVKMSRSTRTRSERGYDRLALIYQAIERVVFGGHLQAARVALLDQLPSWQRMLLLGDGDGRLLEVIVEGMRKGSDQTIISVDHSEAMLHQQRNRIANQPASKQVEWIKTDALSFTPDENSFDVIVTPFFLDCFTTEQLQSALPQWRDGLRQEGRWYYVDFVVPQQGWRRIPTGFLCRVMHTFFRLATGLPNSKLLNVPSMLRQMGLEPEQQNYRFGGMMVTEIYGLTDSVGDESPKT